MSPIRLHKWVFGALTRLYPGRYFACRIPVVKPKRLPVSLGFEQFDRIEAPTPTFGDPGTAHLLGSIAALHEPLPPIVQFAHVDQPSVRQTFQPAVSDTGRASQPAGRPETPHAGPSWWRSEVYGDGAAATQAQDARLLSALTGADLYLRLTGLPSPDAPFLDPLADFVPVKHQPPLSVHPPHPSRVTLHVAVVSAATTPRMPV